MTLIEDAKRLADREPFELVGRDPYDKQCSFCAEIIGEPVDDDEQGEPVYTVMPHAPDCPWLALPRIVVALEAARAVVGMYPSDDEPSTEYGVEHTVVYVFCDGDPYAKRHSPGCQWQALNAALRGEGATA